MGSQNTILYYTILLVFIYIFLFCFVVLDLCAKIVLHTVQIPYSGILVSH